MSTKAEAFWSTYLERLSEHVQTDPGKYALRPDENAIDYARRVAARMRATVEAEGFGGINYRESKAFRAAARAAGVPFTLAGLRSVYEEVQS